MSIIDLLKLMLMNTAIRVVIFNILLNTNKEYKIIETGITFSFILINFILQNLKIIRYPIKNMYTVFTLYTCIFDTIRIFTYCITV
jgi:hypothetical protein